MNLWKLTDRQLADTTIHRQPTHRHDHLTTRQVTDKIVNLLKKLTDSLANIHRQCTIPGKWMEENGSVNHIVSLFVKADKKIPNNTSSRVTLVFRRSHIIPNQSSLMNHFAPSLFTFQGFNKLVYIWVSLTNDTSEPVMPAFEKIICAWVISRHTFIEDQVASNKRKAGRNFSFFYPNEKKTRYTWAVKNIGPFVCELLCRWLVAVGQLVCRWIFVCELSVGQLSVGELSCYC